MKMYKKNKLKQTNASVK